MAAERLPAAVLAALASLAELKSVLEQPVSTTDAPHLQAALNAGLNRTMERLRDVESAGGVFPGVVDAEVVDFLSGTTSSHPDVLLQARLQEALDAKTAADVRVAALKAFAAAIAAPGVGSTSGAPFSSSEPVAASSKDVGESTIASGGTIP